MSKDILLIVDSLSHEKGVDKSVIFEAIEAALSAVTAKRYDEDVDIRVEIDQETGEYETFRRWTVVNEEDLEEELRPDRELLLVQAQEEFDPELEVGDVVEEPIESVEFGGKGRKDRIAAQQAKQVIMQKVREAERAKTLDNFRTKIGTIITGEVKQVKKGQNACLVFEFGDNVEGIIYKEGIIQSENNRVGDRVRAYLQNVKTERGPQLILSRTCPEMLSELFRIEVPEIAEEVIEIKSAARDPGSRAKIAVKTNDGRIDPRGACIGMRGSRVQAISAELNGERVEVVLWDDNPAQLVINAMEPAEVASIVVDEDTHSMDIAVAESQLSQAIGRSGQNVRLASELTGWTLNVMSVEEAEEKSESESETARKIFMETLDVDEDVAAILLQEGFSTLEEVAYVPLEEMIEIEEFDEEMAEELQARARAALLTKEIATEEALSDVKPADDLLGLEGMTDEIAYQLARSGIITQEDLAEKSVDDVADVKGMSDELAAKLIMAARAPWFTEQEEGS